MQALDKLAALIRIHSVSAKDQTDEDEAAFQSITEALPTLFPHLHQVATRELIGDRGILYHWRGTDPTLAPALCMAHFDVVPPGDPASWDFDPFSGELVDGRIRGRGALDDRAMLTAILEAADQVAATGDRPHRDVYLALGGDEEHSGARGAGRIAATLKERGVGLSFVLDEGGAVATDQLSAFTDRPVALIGTAEKGYLTLTLHATGTGGHASTPARTSAVGAIARAVAEIERYRFPVRLGATAKGMFKALGTASGGIKGALLSFPNLTRPLLVKALQAAAETNALLRTTAAPTMISGGTQANVIPTSASAVVNLRVIPGETLEQVTERVRGLVVRFGVTVEPKRGTMREPVGDSPTTGPQWELLTRLCEQTWPGVVTSPHLMTGTTDSSWYRGLTRHVYRFIPMEVDTATMRSVHGPNESIEVSSWEKMVSFMERLYRSLDYRDGA